MHGASSSEGIPELPESANEINETDESLVGIDPPSSPKPIQVLGGVKNPGSIPFQEGANLEFYLTEAGAASSASEHAKVQIIRGDSGKKKAQEFELGAGAPPAVRGGDIVIVHPSKEPEPHFLEKPLTIAASAAAFLGAVALCALII